MSRRDHTLIFTRRFGALRARETFTSTTVMNEKAYLAESADVHLEPHGSVSAQAEEVYAGSSRKDAA
jgi:hypothetical protein